MEYDRTRTFIGAVLGATSALILYLLDAIISGNAVPDIIVRFLAIVALTVFIVILIFEIGNKISKYE